MSKYTQDDGGRRRTSSGQVERKTAVNPTSTAHCGWELESGSGHNATIWKRLRLTAKDDDETSEQDRRKKSLNHLKSISYVSRNRQRLFP